MTAERLKQEAAAKKKRQERMRYLKDNRHLYETHPVDYSTYKGYPL